ncbi:MAG: shikimate dehydrogenase [Fimbriimonas sp.]
MTEVYEWRDAPVADFAVIGDPIGHSLSPAMHQAAYRELGVPYRYVAIHVPPGGVAAALDHLKALGYRGVNATVPHKQEVIDWCEEVEPFARRVGAANTISLDVPATRCINTDAPGFMETLPALPETVLLLGAGGSARSLAAALSDCGCRLRIYNRTRARAEEMVNALGLQAELLDRPDLEGADLVLNTTSSSLSGESLALDWNTAKPGALAYDLVYGNTPFLEEAEKAGLRTLDGLPLLVAQGALSLEWWLRIRAPRAAMMEALRCAS